MKRLPLLAPVAVAGAVLLSGCATLVQTASEFGIDPGKVQSATKVVRSASGAAKQILEPIIRQSMKAMTGITREDLEKLGREKLDDVIGEGKDKVTRELGRFLNRGKD